MQFTNAFSLGFIASALSFHYMFFVSMESTSVKNGGRSRPNVSLWEPRLWVFIVGQVKHRKTIRVMTF